MPGVLGHVLSQSGAFELDDRGMVTSELVRYLPQMPVKIWMDVGQFEWLLGPNRRMHASLVEFGYDVIYREYPGGHNYPYWRNDIWQGLEAFFGV